jgi:hypothetical protein
VTVKVYAVFSESPETVIGEDALVPVSPPGLDVAVYVDPAYAPGAVNVTDAVLKVSAVAVPTVGTDATGVIPAISDL